MRTYMWKIGPGEFLIQTDDPEIARKLSRRRRPKLMNWGVNVFRRTFILSGIKPQNALRTLCQLLRRKCKWNPDTEEWE